jgi:hypothetical protein
MVFGEDPAAQVTDNVPRNETIHLLLVRILIVSVQLFLRDI